MKSASNHAEVSQIAKGYGVDVSAAEVLKFAAQQTAELDDEDLEGVAGGAWTDSKSQDTSIAQTKIPIADPGAATTIMVV